MFLYLKDVVFKSVWIGKYYSIKLEERLKLLIEGLFEPNFCKVR